MKVSPQTRLWLDNLLLYLHKNEMFHEYLLAVSGAQSENFIWAPMLSRFGFVLECDSGQWVITLPGADSDHQIVLVDCVGSPKIPNVATCRAVPRYYELINEIEVR